MHQHADMAGAATTLLRGGDDTIAAVATVPGRSALAVIRVSGPAAHDIVRRVAHRWPAVPRVIVRTAVANAGGNRIDDAMVIRYDAPASFTGEPMAELITHGGEVVPVSVLAALVAAGARVAEPGEFTRRAVLAGKLDLLQAEATADLIDATSGAAQRAALQQLDGGLSRRIETLRRSVLEVEALVAYDIDFPEEDDGPVSPARVDAALAAARAQVDALLATVPAGEMIRHGALVVLAGAPNVGKSSLFNALLGRQRAIVTPVPGTTRDALEAVLDAGRWPIRLADTAGIRDTQDVVETLGVDMTRQYLSRAQVVLACGDDAATVLEALESAAGAPAAMCIVVATKGDVAGHDPAWLSDVAQRAGAVGWVTVSAETGQGLAQLAQEIERAIDRRVGQPVTDAPVLTHARHERVLARAAAELEAFAGARSQGMPAVIAAVHLRAAVGVLEELIGAVDVEQVLGELFSRFCVGK
jgi:tRNA modification GTPase